MSNALLQYAQQRFCYEVNHLRAFGLTDEQIAANKNEPLAVVQGVPLPRPKPERSRAVQHQQLMKMAAALMPRVEEGEREAIQLMLKVMQREASLLGLDAPKEVISHNYNAMVDKPLDAIPTAELERLLIEGTCTVVTEGDTDE